MLWAGLRVAMWIAHVGGKFRHGLLETSLIFHTALRTLGFLKSRDITENEFSGELQSAPPKLPTRLVSFQQLIR